jgi:hypothetical protein
MNTLRTNGLHLKSEFLAITAKEEHAGRLFVIRGLNVRGMPAYAFEWCNPDRPVR